MTITKAVIPVAGLGRRMLPASSVVSKCLFPVVDVPVIQYVVEEAVAAGITEIVFVTGSNRDAIHQYFSGNGADTVITRRMQAVRDQCDFSFVVQDTLNGLGGAVSCARQLIGDHSFALLLGDALMRADRPVIGQLMALVGSGVDAIVGVEVVDPSIAHRYGIVQGKKLSERLLVLTDLVEKPAPGKAPTNLAIAGRYILPARIFPLLEQTAPGINGEVQLTDAVRMLLDQHDVHALRFAGKRYDIGNKFDFIRTNIEFGLDDPETCARLTDLIHTLGSRN